jgi:hypothetical protein
LFNNLDVSDDKAKVCDRAGGLLRFSVVGSGVKYSPKLGVVDSVLIVKFWSILLY